MVMHARSGGSLEVMGYMQGKIQGDAFVVTDAFRLPVEGTETRVNASDEANEYTVSYLEACRNNGQADNAVGWYHSHPGYGCWLSGIDVTTQATHQKYGDPFLAVVIDPDRTISAGKVEIGAFRTYPDNYQPPANQSTDDDYQTIPTNKAADYGTHANRYYPLEISHYKSTLDTHILDQLWNKYWVSTLSQSPLFTNRDYGSKQMKDLSAKVKATETSVLASSRMSKGLGRDKNFEKLIRDSNKVVGEEVNGLMASETKAKLFNGIS
jgi:COP9 signalosome complex subunit 5